MNRLRQLLAPLSPPEQAALLRALSDLESGSPRQWLLLEIAATLGPAQASRRTQVAALVARWLGTAVLLPLLERWQLPGIEPYQNNAQLLGRCARQALDDASLLLVSLTALLAGFDRLPASRQFAAWLLLLIGGAIKYWRVHRHHPIIAAPENTGEETLPGAEAALGLHGLLLARGAEAAQARALLANLRAAPRTQLAPIATALPELLPPPPERRDFLRAALAGWCGAILPALWLNGWQWGWVVTVLWAMGLAWFAHRSRTFPALILALTVSAYLLARIAHAM
ncbi:MAG: hypothetical protein H6R07_1738 [Proteobacteria bacterium]|nr:hypothetical protein [Pseudomonadota bacterium]